jgi:hypothetical protein
MPGLKLLVAPMRALFVAPPDTPRPGTPAVDMRHCPRSRGGASRSSGPALVDREAPHATGAAGAADAQGRGARRGAAPCGLSRTCHRTHAATGRQGWFGTEPRRCCCRVEPLQRDVERAIEQAGSFHQLTCFNRTSASGGSWPRVRLAVRPRWLPLRCGTGRTTACSGLDRRESTQSGHCGRSEADIPRLSPNTPQALTSAPLAREQDQDGAQRNLLLLPDRRHVTAAHRGNTALGIDSLQARDLCEPSF